MFRTNVRSVKQRYGSVCLPDKSVLELVQFGARECVVLEVGANRAGFAGELLAQAPLATVHCFEPKADLLLRNAR